MKRTISLLCVMVLVLGMLAGCAGNNGDNEVVDESIPDVQPNTADDGAEQPDDNDAEPGEQTLLRVGALKGPTGMGIVGLMASAEQGTSTNAYEFTLDTAPDVIQGKLISGELDIAALPTNLAAVLYERTGGEVQMLAINTLGVLYIVQGPDGDVSTLADLAGKTIYTAGQGSTQEYVLNYLLEQGGLADSVTVEYRSDHAEVATLLVSGECDIALLPQPFVTNVTMRDDSDITVAVDVTEEWERLSGGTELVMGCMVARREVVEANGEAIRIFLDEYAQSTEFVNNNVDQAAELIGVYEIVDAAVALAAIPKCNIVCITGETMKTSAQQYLAAIAEQNIDAVGGNIPDEGLYYLP